MTRNEFAAILKQQEQLRRETPSKYRCPQCGSYDCNELTIYDTPETILDEQVICQTCFHTGILAAFTVHEEKK